MLRVRHTINDSKGMLLQFREYKANAYKVEVKTDQKLNRKIAKNVGSWLCTFVRPTSIQNKPKLETFFVGSKKKIVRKFKEFILSDFPTIIETQEENQLVEVANTILDRTSKSVRDIRNAIKSLDAIQINTLIHHVILDMNKLQTKLSEMEEKK